MAHGSSIYSRLQAASRSQSQHAEDFSSLLFYNEKKIYKLVDLFVSNTKELN